MPKPLPLYRELSDKISQDLLSRHLSDGDFYLTLKELCHRFQVSLITARKAVSLLESNDILRCKSSAGLFVKDIAALNILNSSRNIILIFHRHSQKKLSVFYELRLSAMVRSFIEAGFSTKIIYDEDLHADSLKVIGQSLRGIVCGARDAGTLSRLPVFSSVPILYLNTPAPPSRHPGDCQVFYDLEGQQRLSLRYWRQTGSQQVMMITGEDEDSVKTESRLKTEHLPFAVSLCRVPVRSMAAGKELALRLLRENDRSSYWICDDFIAMGFCYEYLKHGIDLIAGHRILVNSSPILVMTQELGFPVIGFSPVEYGSRAAEYFLRNMNRPAGHEIPTLHIPATANQNVSFQPENRPQAATDNQFRFLQANF